MRRVLRFIDAKFEEIIGVTMLAACLTLIFVGVVMRLAFKSGIPWQEELSRILYVLVVYIGASYGMKSKDHIRVTFVLELVPPTVKRVMEIVTDIIWLGFNVAVVMIFIDVFPKMRRFFGESAILKVPLHLILLTVPVGCVLVSLRLIQGYFVKPTAEKPAEA